MLDYNKALEIQSDKNNNFIIKKFNVNGYNASLFCYQVSTLTDFERYGRLDNDALNMRSALFIHKDFHEEYIPSLQKFFNINENKYTVYSELKDKKIICVQEKCDGSLLQPILLDDKIIWRTQKSFDNEQTKLADEFMKNNLHHEEFIRHEIDLGNQLFFELISPLNKIVVDYNKTELRLLTIRSEFGIGFPVTTDESYYNAIGIITANVYKHTLDELIEKQKTEVGIEGWVVYFDDMSMLKIKTEEYFIKHRLVECSEREHDIIRMFLDGKIDDILSQLSEHESEKRELVENVVDKIDKTIHQYFTRIKQYITSYHEVFKENRKDFSLAMKDNELFHVTIKNLNSNDEDILKGIHQYIMYRTKTLEQAREYLKEIK